MSDKAQIFNELQSYIVEQLGVEKEKVTPTAAFIEDLNADSLDLVEFAMGLEEKFGVTAAAPVAVAAVGGAAGGAAPAAEVEKDEFSVILKDGGAQKIQVIKVVRELTSLGLKEAKDASDSVEMGKPASLTVKPQEYAMAIVGLRRVGFQV